jgi:hypothetical protein
MWAITRQPPILDEIGVIYRGPFYNPFFIPKKHTKMSYAKQNRMAKRRRKKY